MCTSMKVVPFSIRVELLVRVSVVYWTDVSVRELTRETEAVICNRRRKFIASKKMSAALRR